MRFSVKLPIAINDSPLSQIPIHRTNEFCSSLLVTLIMKASNLKEVETLSCPEIQIIGVTT